MTGKCIFAVTRDVVEGMLWYTSYTFWITLCTLRSYSVYSGVYPLHIAYTVCFLYDSTTSCNQDSVNVCARLLLANKIFYQEFVFGIAPYRRHFFKPIVCYKNQPKKWHKRHSFLPFCHTVNRRTKVKCILSNLCMKKVSFFSAAC